MGNKTKNNLIHVFLIISIIIFSLLFIRILFLVLSSNNLKVYDNPKISSQIIRGNIYDRNGKILAIQTSQHSLYIDKRYTDDVNSIAVALSPFINMSVSQILDRCDLYNTRALIKRGISLSDANKIKEIIDQNGLINSVILEKYQARTYPQTFHASQVIGFVNTKNEGLEGLEYSQNDILLPYPELNKEYTYGSDIYTTLDLDLQYLLDISVQNILLDHNPKYVFALIMDAKNGEVLASSSAPWYNLNSYSTSTLEERLNRTISYNYEIGSVFKIFTLAAVKEAGIDIEPFICDGEETFVVNNECFTINCTDKHGVVDEKTMISQSCNGAIAAWTMMLDEKFFYNFIKDLGFTYKYDINLSGIESGFLAPIDSWSSRTQATLAIGQEITATALQVATAATTLANDGNLIYPSIIKKIVNQDGKAIENEIKSKKVFSSGIAQDILMYMQNATIEGTAQKANIEGVEISAKTGTAQIIDDVTKKYSKDSYLASTLALVPTEDPKYIIYFGAYEPKEGTIYGADVTAPEINKIIKGLINQGKISKENQFVINI